MLNWFLQDKTISNALCIKNKRSYYENLKKVIEMIARKKIIPDVEN